MFWSSSRDRYNGVWLIFFMLGLGTLLPWNFFMTATVVSISVGFCHRNADKVLQNCKSNHYILKKQKVCTSQVFCHLFIWQYFTSRLADPLSGANVSVNATEEASRSVLQAKFNNVMTLCAMVPLLIFTCLNSVLHQRSDSASRAFHPEDKRN